MEHFGPLDKFLMRGVRETFLSWILKTVGAPAEPLKAVLQRPVVRNVPTKFLTLGVFPDDGGEVKGDFLPANPGGRFVLQIKAHYHHILQGND